MVAGIFRVASELCSSWRMVEVAVEGKRAGNCLDDEVTSVVVREVFPESSEFARVVGGRDFIDEEFVEELAERLFRTQVPLVICLPLDAECLFDCNSGALFARR